MISFRSRNRIQTSKARARVFEAPIRYVPRGYEEGKKIGRGDGWRALIASFVLDVDDYTRKIEYGSHILVELEHTASIQYMDGDALRPYIGDRVLGIGAGIAHAHEPVHPPRIDVASDINPNPSLSAFVFR